MRKTYPTIQAAIQQAQQAPDTIDVPGEINQTLEHVPIWLLIYPEGRLLIPQGADPDAVMNLVRRQLPQPNQVLRRTKREVRV